MTTPTPTISENGLSREVRDGVLALVLQRPESLNSVTTKLLQEMTAAFESVAEDPGVRAVTVTGAGRGFSSGADLQGSQTSGEGVSVQAANELIRAMTSCPVPVIAMVNGPAAGVGCSIALACDLVLMARSSYLMLAFTKIGLMPDGGATALVAASAGRQVAMRMALLAEKLPAEQALTSGLAAMVYDDDELVSQGEALAARLAAGATLSLAHSKRAINAATLIELENALEREAVGQGELGRSADFKEGVSAFRERRSPVFTGR